MKIFQIESFTLQKTDSFVSHSNRTRSLWFPENPFLAVRYALGAVQIQRTDLKGEEVDRSIEKDEAAQDGENFVNEEKSMSSMNCCKCPLNKNLYSGVLSKDSLPL